MMKSLVIVSVILVLSSLYFSCASQGTFSASAKLGLGGSAIPVNALLEYRGTVNKAFTGTTLTTGVVTSYIIGNRIGIESAYILRTTVIIMKVMQTFGEDVYGKVLLLLSSSISSFLFYSCIDIQYLRDLSEILLLPVALLSIGLLLIS
jgi:hypothetical protein